MCSTESQMSELSPEKLSGYTSTDSTRTVSRVTETPCNRLTPLANTISKCLVQYIPTKKVAETRVMDYVYKIGLCVLTSSEGITMLDEKQGKKQKERRERKEETRRIGEEETK